MPTRKTVGKLRTFGQVWIVLGVLVLLNLLVSGLSSCRIDLTERREYSLSPASKNLFQDLKDPVRVKLFFSSDLPPALERVSGRVVDILGEYQAYAKGKLNFQLLHPDLDQDAALLAGELGIPEVQFNIIKGDRSQIQKSYFGIAVYYEDRFSTISLITNENQLEYELSSAISKAKSRHTPTIGFWSGHQSMGISGRYRIIAQEMKKRYLVAEVDLRKKGKDNEPLSFEQRLELLKGIDTLVIVRPNRVSLEELAVIDQFVMEGKKTLWLVDTIAFTGEGMFTREHASGVLKYLEHMGVKVQKEMVLDGQNATGTFDLDGRQVKSAYPLWPLVTSRFMDRNNPVMNRLESLVLPWTSPLETLAGKLKGKAVIKLAFSSKNSWSELLTGHNLAPRSRYNPPQGIKVGSRTLAVVIGGRFPSFFEKNPLPPGVLKEEVPLRKSRPTHLAVIGNSNFLLNNMIRNYPSNAIFFMNLVDWLNSGDELLAIRAKTDSSRPLRQISPGRKLWFRLANILMVPILIVLVSGAVFLVRRKRESF